MSWSKIQTPTKTILIEARPEVALNVARGMVAGVSIREDEIILSEVSEKGISRFLRENPGTMVIRKTYLEARR